MKVNNKLLGKAIKKILSSPTNYGWWKKVSKKRVKHKILDKRIKELLKEVKLMKRNILNDILVLIVGISLIYWVIWVGFLRRWLEKC